MSDLGQDRPAKGLEQVPAPADRRAAKRYTSPKLIVYGSFRELTRANGNDPPLDAAFAASMVTT